jgi:hypothetical protein
MKLFVEMREFASRVFQETLADEGERYPEQPRPLRLDAALRQVAGLACELPSIHLFSVWREKCVAGK